MLRSRALSPGTTPASIGIRNATYVYVLLVHDGDAAREKVRTKAKRVSVSRGKKELVKGLRKRKGEESVGRKGRNKQREV